MITSDNLNTMPLSRLARLEVRCSCGRVHRTETAEIQFGEGVIEALPAVIERVLAPLVRVCLVADRTCFDMFGISMEKRLISGGFRCERFVFEDGSEGTVEGADRLLKLPEDVRILVSVGGGSVCDTVKYAAHRLKMPYIAIMTSPCSDTMLSPYSVLRQRGFREVYVTKPPAALIADINIISACGSALIAAGYGAMAAKRIALFDWRLARIIRGEYFCRALAQQVEGAIAAVEREADALAHRDRIACAALTENVLRVSLLAQMLGSSRLNNGGETHLAHALEMRLRAQRRPLRLYGETVLLAAGFLTKIYPLFLKAEIRDFIPPPDLGFRAEKIAATFNADETDALKKVKPYLNIEEYNVAAHKFREYRGELYAAAVAASDKIAASFKMFKRMYPDAGYWLKDYLLDDDFRICLALAPDIREKYTLLTYMRDLGLLEPYLV